MLVGDLTTMSLPDLLQWADMTRRSGSLSIESDGLVTLMTIVDRMLVRTSSPPPPPVAIDGLALEGLDDSRALERLFDLFVVRAGRFHFYEEGEEDPSAQYSVDLPLAAFVMEGMRYVDEWPALDKAYRNDGARIHRTTVQPSQPLSALQKALLTCAARKPSLSELRLWLGISRPALLRRVEELHVHGLLGVTGADAGNDPIAKLVAKAMVLLRERQFEEAGIVFSSLFASDPSDLRIRRLMQDAERQEIAALYEELDPMARVVLGTASAEALAKLSSIDRQVVGCVNDRLDVSGLVLSSPFRELETLKRVRRLARLGILALRHPSS